MGRAQGPPARLMPVPTGAGTRQEGFCFASSPSPGTVQPDTRARSGGGTQPHALTPPASARNWYVNGIFFNMVRLIVYFILIKVEGSCISAKHNGMIFLLQQRSNKDTLFSGQAPAILAATVPAWLWPSPVPTAWRSRRAPGAIRSDPEGERPGERLASPPKLRLQRKPRPRLPSRPRKWERRARPSLRPPLSARVPLGSTWPLAATRLLGVLGSSPPPPLPGRPHPSFPGALLSGASRRRSP